MAALKNTKSWKSRFSRFSSKSNQEEHKKEGSTKHDAVHQTKSCLTDQTADQTTDLVATNGSRSKGFEGNGIHSVEVSGPYFAKKHVPLRRIASEPERQVLATDEFRAPRHYRCGSLQIDRASRHDRFQGIRNLDLPTRRLLEIDIIEPLDFDRHKYEMVFGRGLRSYK